VHKTLSLGAAAVSDQIDAFMGEHSQ